MTRIVSGSVGGRRIETPPGSATRPTSDRVREALFSRVGSLLGSLEGALVLDLYAGSGAVGLEALSRGAARAVLVEADRRAAAVVRRNAEHLGLADRAEVTVGPVERVLARDPVLRADLVFVDPPYEVDTAAVQDVVAQAIERGWCAGAALLVVERSTRSGRWHFPDGIDDIGARRYGETTLWYGRACTPRSAPGPSTR